MEALSVRFTTFLKIFVQKINVKNFFFLLFFLFLCGKIFKVMHITANINFFSCFIFQKVLNSKLWASII